jgi:alpha-2-macroglobulin
MDINALGATLKKGLFRTLAGGSQLPRLIFGNFSWRPPFWLARSAAGWNRIQHKHPRLIATAIIGLFLVAGAGVWTWNWYDHLPKPRRVTVKVQPIELTKLEKQLQFPRLVVYFSEPAARLEDLHKPSTTGVRIEPQMAGGWHWASSDVLVFQPTQDWPADQKFRIIFDREFFPRHVVMERFVYEAHTKPFVAAMKQMELYQDPMNPGLRQVTATVELTHAVEPGELERHLQLSMIGGASIFPPNDPAPHFTVTYGLHKRLAYIRSSPVIPPEHDDFMKLTLSKGLRTSQGGAETHDAVERKLQIPSVASMFRIDSIAANIARNKANEPEQVLVLTTTANISTRDLAMAIEMRLLPKRPISDGEKEIEGQSADDEATETTEETEEKENQTDASDAPGESQLKDAECWQSASAVSDEVFDHSRPVSYVALPSAEPQTRQHAFRVRIENDGELYIRVHKGIRALGDYPLTDDHNAVVRVPAMPREVQIEGQGCLLALNGERKLSIRSRGLRAIEYEVARVATTQINHLVSQTEGKFQHPHFSDPDLFNQENISRIALERQGIAFESKWKANYSAFDFSEHLRKPADGGSERGLFFVTARGWDGAKKKPISAVKDSRFILVTDIGILTKSNADGSSDVFLMSIKQGKPLPNVTVDLLGKNGIPLQTAKSDTDGRCSFASV